MKRRKRHALAILAFAAMFGCSKQPTPATTPTLDVVILDIQSTNDFSRLLRDLATGYSEEFPHLEFDIFSADYRTVLHNLENNKTPYFITSRLPNTQQWAAPIAQDGIAIITDNENPITELTLDQLRDIYQGKITNWRQIGGNDLKITVLTREKDVDARAEFERMVMGRRRITPNAEMIPSENAMIKRVAQVRGSIGYISFSLLQTDIRPLKIDEVTPTLETIANNTYPLRSTIFIVGIAEPEDEYMSFIQWIQSAQGQAIIDQRYVPLPP